MSEPATEYRAKSIYVTFGTWRILRAAAKAEGVATADAFAEQLIANALLARFPNLKQAAAQYDAGRKRLEAELADALK